MIQLFKKIILSITLIFVATNAHSELKLLEDSKMKKVKGQAGITIDIEYKLSVGEFAYKDGESGGSILVQGLRIGGNKNIGTNNNLNDRTYTYAPEFK